MNPSAVRLHHNLSPTGYEPLEILHQGRHSLVYRALRNADQTSVIIKTTLPQVVLRSSHYLAFRNQFTISQNLDHPGIIQILSLEPCHQSYALVMEDVQSVPLSEFLQSSVSLQEGLSIAIQLSDVLHYLAQQRVLHKDLKPANILIHPQTLQVKLIDFGIASLLPKEAQEIKDPNTLEGTLAYMAPEQTGRMNRGIDSRSDFYGLGITLFELFAGQLPFQADEPMGWLHCHIAQVPPSLTEFGVPATLAHIVAKLLSKNAEDRYQSALGLKYDLERCIAQLTEQGEIKPFELGQRDVCDRFLMPEKLYGREAEVQTLLDAFGRVAKGSSELMLVAGFSGIGKTAVINEVHKPITQQAGYFIKGKFDQFNRNVPFSAFVQAFRSLMNQLLGESDTQLANWQAKILEAVGENGQVVIEVIPELERIIGEQPAVPELSGIADQNRFNFLFGKFIQVFTTPEHPLVIFLDDLQWADLASLNLLKLLMSESKAGYLLILGAYRENEVSPAHPLIMTLDEIEKQFAALQTLTLGPLSQSDINVLVADTLQCEPKIAAPLTELMYVKAEGNPFFTNRFFLSLYHDGYITYDLESGHWQCDLMQVRQFALTDDVVGFMVGQLQKLPINTQEILKIAACIGNQFELSTLSAVCQQPQESISAALWSSLQMGLVILESDAYKFFLGNSNTESLDHPIEPTYHFLHDHVQQAAYSLIPEIEKGKTHYHIGKLLSKDISEEQIEANIFAIIGQLNRGQNLLVQQSERDELARMNFMAGLRSKNATAYKAGFEYANIGLVLLGENQWQSQYELTLKLTNLAVELASLVGDFSAMELLAANIQNNAIDPADRSLSIQTKVQFYTSQQNFDSAISTASDYLESLNFSLPKHLSFEDVQHEYRIFQSLIKETSHQDILGLPFLSDPKQLAIVNTLMSVSVPAVISDTNLAWFVFIKLVEFSLTNGNSPYSAYAYACYGVLINLIEQDIEKHYQFGQLSLDVVDLFEKNITRCRVFQVVGAYTTYLKSHLRTSVPLLEKAYKSGLKSGDFEFSSYSVYGRCQILFFSGSPLSNLQTELSRGIEALDRLNNKFSLDIQKLIAQATLKLTGQIAQSSTLNSKFFKLNKVSKSLKAASDNFSLQHVYLYEIFLNYLFLDKDHILDVVESCKENLDAVTGWLTEYIFHFYESLVYLDYLSCTKALEKEQINQYLQKIQINQNKFLKLAESAPMNFQHKYDLVEAEKKRFLDNKLDALELYDAAINGARENGYLQEEALANELAARFYLDWGKDKVASTYMQEAYHCYARWGAKAKSDDLERRYPELLQPILQAASPSINPLDTLASLVAPNLSIHSSASVHSTQTNFNAAFDFSAILKGAQVLSDSLRIDELLEKLAPMMLQNSGADRLVFLLPNTDTWQIRATATPEITQLCTVPLTDHPDLPLQLIQYVKNTQETLVIDNLKTDLPILDRYLETHQPQSVLCLPILYQSHLRGVLYLQNQLASGVFTRDRITVLNFLCSQAAISLENARLFSERLEIESELHQLNTRLDQRVQERTQELTQTLDTLKSTQASLVEAEKMAALGTLVAGVAHEINTPIGTSITVASTLADESEVFVQAAETGQLKRSTLNHFLGVVRQCTQLINSNLDRAGDLIKSFKQIAVDQSHRELRTFNLKDYVEEVVTSLQPQVKRSGHHLRVTGAETITLINDPGVIAQIITNLVTNSMKHAYPNGDKGQLQIQIEQREHQAVLTYRDNGCGIPSEHLGKVYDPFFTTARHQGGTGLGLNIVYNIVTQSLKGTIQMESQVDQGTTFAIAIPLEQDWNAR